LHQIKNLLGIGVVAQMVEYLPCLLKALNSNPSIAKKTHHQQQKIPPHNKRNNQWNETTVYRMGKNIYQLLISQGINIQIM
jgi:hypothetical protein